jgi:hypothetical protein
LGEAFHCLRLKEKRSGRKGKERKKKRKKKRKRRGRKEEGGRSAWKERHSQE